MPMLGDMLAAARDSSGNFHSWLCASNPELAAEVERAAAAAGLTPTGWTRAAVADFARLAAEEDWATLISTMRDSGDPGTVCLLAMVHWRLTVACAHHAGHDRQHPSGGTEDERSVERTQA